MIKKTCIPLCNAVGVYLEARSKDATDKGLEALRKAYDELDVADDAMVEKAREQWVSDDDMEIDAGALASRGPDGRGSWVMAWVWVED